LCVFLCSEVTSAKSCSIVQREFFARRRHLWGIIRDPQLPGVTGPLFSRCGLDFLSEYHPGSPYISPPRRDISDKVRFPPCSIAHRALPFVTWTAIFIQPLRVTFLFGDGDRYEIKIIRCFFSRAPAHTGSEKPAIFSTSKTTITKSGTDLENLEID
jgi:hypothetical protein